MRNSHMATSIYYIVYCSRAHMRAGCSQTCSCAHTSTASFRYTCTCWARRRNKWHERKKKQNNWRHMLPPSSDFPEVSIRWLILCGLPWPKTKPRSSELQVSLITINTCVTRAFFFVLREQVHCRLFSLPNASVTGAKDSLFILVVKWGNKWNQFNKTLNLNLTFKTLATHAMLYLVMFFSIFR